MARDDINAILNQVLPFAQQCLQRDGEFFPFAARMDENGDIIAIAANETEGEGEEPSAQDVIDMLTQMLVEAGGEEHPPRAMAICFEATVSHEQNPTPHEAICVQIEDVDGEALLVSLPYTRSEDGSVSCGELAASPTELRFFV